MLDRQDIDALLVGALYGELSSADEAVLTTHLESHPADRNALDDLKAIRTKFQTSRIFELQFEPPQALSALLLQEAARRAPKIDHKESWFQRFVTLFVAHPAMAAATTLVLVVGVAGTVYMKSDRVVEPTASQSKEDITRLQPPAPAVAWGSATIGTEPNADEANHEVAAGDRAGDGVRRNGQDAVAVNLAEEGQKQNVAPATAGAAGAADGKFKGIVATPKHRDQVAFEDGDANKHEAAASPKKQPAPAKPYIEVGRDDRAPKDLESKNGMALDKTTPDEVATGNAAGPAPGNARGAVSTASATRPMQPPQAPVAAAPEPPPPPTTTRAAHADTELAWAKDTHARVTALVKDGKCQAAAPLAIAIRNRTPAYYSSYVATDRELKPCMPYITDATEHSERSTPKAAAKPTDTK